MRRYTLLILIISTAFLLTGCMADIRDIPTPPSFGTGLPVVETPIIEEEPVIEEVEEEIEEEVIEEETIEEFDTISTFNQIISQKMSVEEVNLLLEFDGIETENNAEYITYLWLFTDLIPSIEIKYLWEEGPTIYGDDGQELVDMIMIFHKITLNTNWENKFIDTEKYFPLEYFEEFGELEETDIPNTFTIPIDLLSRSKIIRDLDVSLFPISYIDGYLTEITHFINGSITIETNEDYVISILLVIE